ncbi:MAG: hypothetical protein ACYCZN_14990 [Candidatus Dormibacteria bacterium]
MTGPPDELPPPAGALGGGDDQVGAASDNPQTRPTVAEQGRIDLGPLALHAQGSLTTFVVENPKWAVGTLTIVVVVVPVMVWWLGRWIPGAWLTFGAVLVGIFVLRVGWKAAKVSRQTLRS